MKYSLFIKNALLRSRLRLHSQFGNMGNQVAIMRYHAITENNKNDYVSPKITIPVDVFDRQIKYFSKHYHIISMDEVAECVSQGRPFPKRAVAITFDDGYSDNFTAYQVLKKYEAVGTFYVVAGCIGGDEPLWLFEIIYLIKHTKNKQLTIQLTDSATTFPLKTETQKSKAIRSLTVLIKSRDRIVREEVRRQLRYQLGDVKGLKEKAKQIMLSWDQLREMSNNGMIIGGHTMTHLNLPNASHEDAQNEIIGCKKMLEQELNRPVVHFSYPNGGEYAYYNNSIMNMVKAAGFISSTTSKNGLADRFSDLFEIKRIRVSSNLSEIHYQLEWEPIVNKIINKQLL